MSKSNFYKMIYLFVFITWLITNIEQRRFVKLERTMQSEYKQVEEMCLIHILVTKIYFLFSKWLLKCHIHFTNNIKQNPIDNLEKCTLHQTSLCIFQT